MSSGKTPGIFSIDAQLPPEHEIHANFAKKAAHGGTILANQTIEKLPSRAGDCRGVRRPHAVFFTAQTEIGADADALRAGEIDASQQYCAEQQDGSKRGFGQEILPLENFVSHFFCRPIVLNVVARCLRRRSGVRGSSAPQRTNHALVANQSRLAFTKGVADRDGIFRDPVAAELVRQVSHVMDIKLRLDEKRRLDVELDAESAMDLEVIGV